MPESHRLLAVGVAQILTIGSVYNSIVVSPHRFGGIISPSFSKEKSDRYLIAFLYVFTM